MRDNGIHVLPQRKWMTMTNSGHALPIAPNLLNRDFDPAAAYGGWAGDVTYLRTPHGFVFWAVIIDIFSRFVVGWSVSAMNDRHLVLAALHMARGRRSPDPGLSITAIVAAHTQERTIRLC